jgi:putative Ig domain-containing protein
MRARFGVAAALTSVAVLLGGSTAPAGVRAALPHVTIFGDSIAEAIVENDAAKSILTNGLDVDFEVAPCRRLVQDSCPYNGVRPPTVMQIVKTLGAKIGPTVIVTLGYNEFEDQFARNIEVSMNAFEDAGVKHVFWLTLRAARHPYVNMNDSLVAAAANHPSLIIVDWNLYSRNHPDWFQNDGIHLLGDGSKGMATLLHTTLEQLGIGAKPKPPKRGAGPVRIATVHLPDAKRRRPYAAKVAAAGGRPPYFWSLPRHLPSGLHLRSTGWVSGIPKARPGTFQLKLRVRDARGAASTRNVTLRIRP